MDIQAIRKKVGSKVLFSHRALSGSRAGFFKTTVPGFGYDFDQLRDYQEGDDIRFIDWKSSARSGRTLVRAYKDERCRTMHIVLDVSRSMGSGFSGTRVYECARDIALALVFIGENSDDSIGLHMMSDGIDYTLEPRGGSQQRARLVHALARTSAAGKQTSLSQALRQFGAYYKKRALVFIISDFIDEQYEQYARVVSQLHECIFIRVRDRAGERALAQARGLVFEDNEIGCAVEINDVGACAHFIEEFRQAQDRFFTSLQAPWCDCAPEGNHIETLLAFLDRYFFRG